MGRKSGGPGGRRGPARGSRRFGVEGLVRTHKGGAEVETSMGSYRITSRGLRGAMDGDRVSVSLIRGSGSGRRAVVDRVIERAHTSLVGTYTTMGPLGVLRPLDARIKQDFFILPGDTSPARLGVRPKDIVQGTIEIYPSSDESGVVTLTERLGDETALDLGVRSVMARYGLEDGYASQALSAASKLSLDLEAALADPLRRDIRDRVLVTIDPVDARDFDDAISIEELPSDNWRLGIHIADVSHYVAWGDPIDLEARARGTSVYLADRVLPMLPEALSNDLCSLVPHEDRLACTVDIELTPRGTIRAYEFYPSVIQSRARLDYEAVDAILSGKVDVSELAPDAQSRSSETCAALHETCRNTDCRNTDCQHAIEHESATQQQSEKDEHGEREDHASAQSQKQHDAEAQAADPVARASVAICELAEAGIDLVALLTSAHKVAQDRLRLRHQRGAIDFETTEIHAILDEAGLPEKIVARERTDATSLVEEAMLLANECVAEYLSDRGIPAAFRVHEAPEPEDLAAAAHLLQEIGALSPELAAAVETADSSAIEAAVEAVANTPFEMLANSLLLRAMRRALYKPENTGHYALAAPAYCHFTSPIRRYPDLIVHRQLKHLLAREHLGRAAAGARSRALVGKGSTALEPELAQICQHASDRERVAEAAAHATQKIKVAQYYRPRIGTRLGGVVSWIESLGVFVRLDDTGAEGLIRMRSLGDEWWDIDALRLTMTGSETGRRIRIGSRLEVEIAGVDVLRGHVDLNLVRLVPALH
ncbi:ribonuclease R family protein [Collinsella ureilytica]|uniref:ribonuclease R family protein n=1 Tax=Collinsella ureilytica TaxID=2869515 RepID=UPI00352F28D5